MALEAAATAEAPESPPADDLVAAPVARSAPVSRLDRIKADTDFDDPTMREYADPDDDSPVDGQASPDNELKKAKATKAKNGKPAKAEPVAKAPAKPAKSNGKPAVFQNGKSKGPFPTAAAKAALPGRPAVPQLGDPDDDTDVGGDPAEGDEDSDVLIEEGQAGAGGDADDTDDGFDAALLARAKKYDFTEEEARELGPDALQRTLAAIDRRNLRAWQQYQEQQEQQRQAGAAPNQPSGQQPPAAVPPTGQANGQPPVQPPAKPNAAGEASRPFEKLKLNLDPAIFDEDTIPVINSINDHYDQVLQQQHQKVSQLEAVLAHVAGSFQAEESRRFANAMDTRFADLPEELHEVFGKESLAELLRKDPNSPAVKERMRINSAMSALLDTDLRNGFERPSDDELFQRAVHSLQHAHTETLARKKISKEIAARRGQAVNRPTARKTKPATPEKAAGNFANNFYRERGFADADDVPLEV